MLPLDLAGLQFEITEKEVVDDPENLTAILQPSASEARASRSTTSARDTPGCSA